MCATWLAPLPRTPCWTRSCHWLCTSRSRSPHPSANGNGVNNDNRFFRSPPPYRRRSPQVPPRRSATPVELLHPLSTLIQTRTIRFQHWHQSLLNVPVILPVTLSCTSRSCSKLYCCSAHPMLMVTVPTTVIPLVEAQKILYYKVFWLGRDHDASGGT